MPDLRRAHRRWLGLRARTAVAASLGGLLLTALLSTVAYLLVRDFLLENREQVALQQAFLNADKVRTGLADPDTEVIKLLETLRTEPGSFKLLFYDTKLYGTVQDPALPDSLRAAIAQGDTGRMRYVSGGRPRIAIAVAIPAVDATYVEVFSLRDVAGTLAVVRNSLLAASTLTALGAAALGLWSSRRVLSPIAQIADAAERLAGGSWDTRLGPDPDPDLRRLMASFNEMAGAVQGRIEREARFASDVSHELRTPLAALTGATEVLLNRRDEMPERARPALDIIVHQTSHFSQLVLDLLEISRIDAGAVDLYLEPVWIADLAPKVAARAGFGDVPVEVAPTVAEATALVDKRRFERVVINLLDNAERHGGGAVRLRVEGTSSRIRLIVDDAGPGVPRSERERIFERFARGPYSAQGQGTGLGLALVDEHVRLMGGTVRVSESPESGARFVVEFARDPDDEDER
jgi:signal transduction histidine kinase